MKIIKLKQNTPEWLHYRRTHLGASDAPVIMGDNPWKSVYDLYNEKIFCFEQPDNEYMARGRALEPIALEAFEADTGLTMFPMVFENESIPWMCASLDGITLERDVFVEIKCAGKRDHFLAANGMLPKKYFPQLQHQLCVTGLDLAYYYSFDGEKGVVLEVKMDQEYIDNLLEQEFQFWQCLETLKPPIKNKSNNLKLVLV